MLKTIFLLIALVVVHNSLAQGLHPLEPAKNHYQRLKELDPAPNPEVASLDEIQYPLTDGAGGRQFVGIEPTYLAQEQVAVLQESVQFPANSSDQTKAELNYLLEWERKRTKSNKDRAREIARIGYWPPLQKTSSEYGYHVEDLFWECRSVMGDHCTTQDYPATLHLLAGVTRDMRIIEFTVKYHLLRPRPYHLEPDMDPMTRISSPSFASGHTLWAYIQAFTWSELIPEKRKQFLDLAYEVGESREIMGIHYPSDEEAARILAHKMLEFMWQNQQFMLDLNNAKAEWE